MYIPEAFKVNNSKDLFDFCVAQSFGTVITNSESAAPSITPVPFVIKENDSKNWIVEFHISRDNFQRKAFEKQTRCGLMITGAHGYISSSVYSHENVPTYNYEYVYLTCASEIMSAEALELHLAELVHRFEKDRSNPLTYSQFNRDLLDSYLPEIIGIRLIVEKIEGAFKLSQNRNEEDFKAIVNDISAQKELCQAMKKQFKND